MLVLSEVGAQVTLDGDEGVPMTERRSTQSFCVSYDQASIGCCVGGKYFEAKATVPWVVSSLCLAFSLGLSEGALYP